MPQIPHSEYVTGAEFGRFRADFQAFQTRLEERLEHGFGGVNARLDGLNGRTREAEKSLAVVERRLGAIESEDSSIDATVKKIQKEGCGKLGEHDVILRELGWSRGRKAAVAGGLVGTGVLAWPAIQAIADAAHAILDKLP